MVQRRTNKGVVIDMEALLAQNSDEPAMGNMRVNRIGNGTRSKDCRSGKD